MAKQNKADYEVGYGRPPTSSRFKPGQSGNPKGRPKGSLSWHTAVRDLIDELVPVSGTSGRVKITSGQALLKKLRAKALVDGDHASMVTILQAWKELPDPANDDDDDLAPDDRAVIETFVEALKRGSQGDGGHR